MNVTTVGLLGGFLTSAAAVPQVVRAWRTRKVRDISVWQPVLLVAGMLLWLIYGIALGDRPLILANSFSISCNLVLIALKFMYGGIEQTPDDGYLPAKIGEKGEA